MPASLIESDAANRARFEILKVAGIFDSELQRLIVDRQFNLAATVALSTSLQNFDIESARLVECELPRDPIVFYHSVADCVLNRPRFVLHLHTMNRDIASMAKHLAGCCLNDRLPFAGRK